MNIATLEERRRQAILNTLEPGLVEDVPGLVGGWNTATFTGGSPHDVYRREDNNPDDDNDNDVPPPSYEQLTIPNLDTARSKPLTIAHGTHIDPTQRAPIFNKTSFGKEHSWKDHVGLDPSGNPVTYDTEFIDADRQLPSEYWKWKNKENNQG